MKLAALALALLLTMTTGAARGQVFQQGGVIPQHFTMWSANNAVKDAGTSAQMPQGLQPFEVGITSAPNKSGNPFPATATGHGPNGENVCLYDSPITVPGHYLCLSPNLGNNTAAISVGAIGGATTGSLEFILNGTPFPFPGPGGGNVVGPVSPAPVLGDLVQWNGGLTVSDTGTPASAISLAVSSTVALQGACTSTSGCPGGDPVYSGTVVRKTFGNGNNAPPLMYTASTTACSLNGGNGDNGSQIKAANGGCFLAATTDPLQFGASPGTWNFYTVTTAAGSGTVTVGGANFAAGNIGNWITILGAGPNEQRYIGQITGVTSGTQITVSPPPTLNMSAFSTIVYYGAPNSTPINAAIAASNRLASPTVMPAGIYMVEAPIQCTMFNYNNVQWAQPNCVGLSGAGAILVAVSPMTGSSPAGGTVFTIGGFSGPTDFSQYIRNGHFEGNGLTIDCNMIANFGFGFPFGQDSNVGHFNVKNCLQANFHFGLPGTAQVTGGIHFHNNSVQRDIFRVPVTALSCVSNQPNITTAIDHGIATGRVIALDNINSAPGSVFPPTSEGPTVLEWQSTGARTGIVHGVNCSGWASYSGGGFIDLTPPNTTEVFHITGMSSGTTTTITFVTGSINLANGQTWCVYGIGATQTPFVFQKNVPDGCYTVSGVGVGGSDGPFQFTIPFNSTGATYQGSGITFQQTTFPLTGVYQDNASDFEMSDNIITGVAYGTRANPTGSNYDGKYTTNHFYNLSPHGFMLAATQLGGHNAVIGQQCDPPVVFCAQFAGGYGNTMTSSELNGSGFGYTLDNASWLIRLDGCSGLGCQGGWEGIFNYYSDVTSTGNKIFGQSSTNRVNELSNLGLAGNPAFYAAIPNYHAFGNNCGAFALYCMPDSAVGSDIVVTPNLAPAGTTSTTLVAMGLGPSCQFTPTYHTSGMFTMSGTIGNNTIGDGVYGAMFLFSNSPPANGGSLNGSIAVTGQMGVASTPSTTTRFPFTWTGAVPQGSLVPGNPYYLDAGLRVVGGGSGNIQDLTCTLTEQ